MNKRHTIIGTGLLVVAVILISTLHGVAASVPGSTTSQTGPSPASNAAAVVDSGVTTQIAASTSSIQIIAVTPSAAELGARTKSSGCSADQSLPDSACSPGAVLTTDIQTICVPGYTKTVRDVPQSEKQEVFAEYGIDWAQHSGYEVDHLISLELGGSNDISNLFPESYSIKYNARTKDQFENYLHAQVCSGKMPIDVAQEEISTDWLKYYLAWKG